MEELQSMATSNLKTLLYRKINFQGWCRLPPRINAEQSSNKRRILLIECGVYSRAVFIGNLAAIFDFQPFWESGLTSSKERSLTHGWKSRLGVNRGQRSFSRIARSRSTLS